MSVVIRQIVFLTSSASWCYRFQSRDSVGTVPNNNIAKARRFVRIENYEFARSPTGTCELQFAQAVG